MRVSDATPDLTAGPLLADLKSDPDGPPLTVEEVAEMLRVSKPTVYRQCETGALGHVRVGRAVRIPRGALAEYLKAHGSPGTAPAA